MVTIHTNFIGRSERIRTSDPCLPKAVLYQAELHSDRAARPTQVCAALQEPRGPGERARRGP